MEVRLVWIFLESASCGIMRNCKFWYFGCCCLQRLFALVSVFTCFRYWSRIRQQCDFNYFHHWSEWNTQQSYIAPDSELNSVSLKKFGGNTQFTSDLRVWGWFPTLQLCQNGPDSKTASSNVSRGWNPSTTAGSMTMKCRNQKNNSTEPKLSALSKPAP